MPAGQTVTFAASAARTTSADSGILPGFTGDSLRLQLNTTAVSGTSPTLDVVIEDTVDGTTFNTVATFTQVTAVARQVVNLTGIYTDRLRARWTIGGTTPSFTFNVIAYVEQ